ncbi:hypothetical protein [Borreliella garinii]|uniref:hypothetical protein n=1 Tax=Borreliella garinii TaxID=29519 RepID=UPI00041B0C05|nr:hypothetical protein [Borreliella garinii]
MYDICRINAYRKLTKNNENNSKNLDLLDQLFSSRATYIKREVLIVCLNIKSKVNMMNHLFIMNYAKLDPLFSRSIPVNKDLKKTIIKIKKR